MLSALATTQPLVSRLGVSAVAILVGVVLIVSGMSNVRNQTAHESGARRWVNRAAGRSNTYTGSRAVMLGYLRLAAGVAAVVFGVVFAFVGPFLA